jgi:hypothetical protein
MNDPANNPFAVSRRDVLLRSAGGFGAVALSALLAAERRAAAASRGAKPLVIDPLNPLAPRKPQFAAKAKRVIFLFMFGGPSHLDTFDYKPLLQQRSGELAPDSFKTEGKLFGGPFKWKQRGKSGLWMSDLYDAVAGRADDLCVINSMHGNSSNHAPAMYQMNTGVIIPGKPSMGSWVTYGLGSDNQNLPGYVLLFDVGPLGGSGQWTNAFLPAAFAGTRFRHTGQAVPDLKPPAGLEGVQRSTLDLVQSLNEKHRAAHPGLLDLEGRIASYELAYRMQAEALDVGDLAHETQATREMYGVDDADKKTSSFGRMCLLSRRLVEKGVRFVQLYNSTDNLGWDAHKELERNHRANARQTDKPIAALLKDLKDRGLLNETLVVWAGEFGRTPTVEGTDGRGHNPHGFSVWMAGGGVKGGQRIGATDEIGLRAVDSPASVSDLHATILTALGLGPNDLYFERSGRFERLIGVADSAKAIPRVLG